MSPVRTLFAIALLFPLLAAAEPAKVALLSPEEFTKKCAASMQAAVQRSRVQIEAPLRLVVRDPNTGQATIYLEQSYETYKMAPERVDEVIARHVSSVVEAAPDAGIDPSRIVPVIKPQSWLAEIGSTAERPLVVFDPLNDDLIVVYAEDAPNSVSFFSPSDFERTGIDRQGLRKLAGDNLVQIVPKIERRGEDGVYQINAGGDLETSFIAIGDTWSRESFAVKGDFVFAVPSRGVLYVTGSDDEAGVKSVRDLARTRYRGAALKISPKLFVLRAGELAVLPE